MAIPPEMLVLARHLLTYEAAEGEPAESIGARELRVYERLRSCVDAFAGAAAFHALASRALVLAMSRVPSLGAVRIAVDGSLQGPGELAPQIDTDRNEGNEDQADDGGVVLIAQLLGLLDVFLGESLAIRLLRDAWPSGTFDDSNAGNGRKA